MYLFVMKLMSYNKKHIHEPNHCLWLFFFSEIYPKMLFKPHILFQCATEIPLKNRNNLTQPFRQDAAVQILFQEFKTDQPT